MASDSVIFGALAGLVSAVATAVAMLYRLRPEIRKTTVSIASEAVVVLKTVVDNLTAEMARLQAAHEECEANRAADREHFESEIEELRRLVLQLDERKGKPRRREGM